MEQNAKNETPVASVENANTSVPAASTVENKQKSGTGLKIATAIACLVAVCGIGFGVYGMIRSSEKDNQISEKDGQISELKVQVEDFNGKITTLETEKIETTDENGTTVTIVDSPVKNENPEDYIYVGEWGVKIKISDNLSNISYEFLGDGYSRSCRSLGLSASTRGDGSKPSFVKTGGDKGEYLGYVMRCPKEDLYPYGSNINISDPAYNYYYERIQYSITQTDWESESVDAIKNMLTNPDNYSAI
ncbi:MAG: hypothetical protein Q4A36_03795 [Candidatus Saccharibacteria bacterium]|nr:hypothetical protein [Candidatus Saccharibacteria bacterium]